MFGAATAAYQIEGAASEDGRGPSIWDTFSHKPGKVKNGDTGDVACDHYHRWESDLDLLVELGVDAYRFSISWPRLYPSGSGQLNQAGVSFYNNLINGCVERGIKVYVTLYHWDLPQALAETGGWTNRATAENFARYADTVARLFGDRIDAICTFNEPWCSSILGHLMGVHAPGEKDIGQTLAVIHGQHLAHGLAVQAIRQQRPDLPTGIVLNVQAISPASHSAEDIAAAGRHDTFNNALFLAPLFEGEYPTGFLENLEHHLPANWQDDMSTIFQPLDYWGLNYYTPEYVEDANKDSTEYPHTRLHSRKQVERTDIGWEIDASALTRLLLTLYQRYTLPPVYITENGAAYNQGPIDGVIDDQLRIEYLKSHLAAAKLAMEKAVPLKGYFAWSLMDNFEWAEGYSMRFGLIHVDYQSQQRTFKNSALWYRDFIEQHRESHQ